MPPESPAAKSPFWILPLLVLTGVFLVTNIVPNIMFYVVFLTAGLGLPLLFVNTALLYFLAALPMIVFLGRTPPRWGPAVLAACLIPLVAFGIPRAAETIAATRMQALLAGDVSGRFAETPKSIELVGEGGWQPGFDALRSAPCDVLCQRLLLSGQVDLVRVTRSMRQFPGRPARFDYVIERRDTCPDAFGQGETLLPATRDAVVSGTCFVARPAGEAPVAARVVIERPRTPDPRNLAEDIAAAGGAVRETQTLEIFALDGGNLSVRVRQTQLKYTHWTAPLFLWFAGCDGMCIGKSVFGRSEKLLNRFDPAEQALRALGIGEPAPAGQLSPARRVMAMLDGAGATLTRNQNEIVREWATGKRCGLRGCDTLTAEDEAAVLRVVQDRRVTEFNTIGVLMRHNPRIVSRHIELFLAGMEARGGDSELADVTGVVLAQLDIAELRPHRDRLLPLIRDNKWQSPDSRSMGSLAGRLGLDTVALIAGRLDPKRSSHVAAFAACVADDDVGRRLVPHLLDYLRALPVNAGLDSGPRLAVKALARFGHYDEAKELFLAAYPQQGARTLPRPNVAGASDDVVGFCHRG